MRFAEHASKVKAGTDMALRASREWGCGLRLVRSGKKRSRRSRQDLMLSTCSSDASCSA